MERPWLGLTAAAFALVSACANESENAGVSAPEHSSTALRDIDGNAYRVVERAGQLWMAENLRTTRTPSGSPLTTHAPDDDAGNIEAYGLLYDWDEAQRACPTGWRLPSDAEWSAFIDSVGVDNAEFWLDQEYWMRVEARSGADASGFAVRPAGYWNGAGLDNLFGSRAVLWTATEDSDGEELAWSRVVQSNGDPIVRRASQHAHYGFSVRCVAGNG